MQSADTSGFVRPVALSLSRPRSRSTSNGLARDGPDRTEDRHVARGRTGPIGVFVEKVSKHEAYEVGAFGAALALAAALETRSAMMWPPCSTRRALQPSCARGHLGSSPAVEPQSSCRPVEAIDQELEIVGSTRASGSHFELGTPLTADAGKLWAAREGSRGRARSAVLPAPSDPKCPGRIPHELWSPCVADLSRGIEGATGWCGCQWPGS